jgi:hypothetical protein
MVYALDNKKTTCNTRPKLAQGPHLLDQRIGKTGYHVFNWEWGLTRRLGIDAPQTLD